MKLKDLIQKYNLNHSVLIGYYGGGNYGDELLMEVLSNLLSNAGVTQLSIMYQTPQTFSTYHHDFGYSIVPAADKKQLFKAILRNKNVIIGGGGLWGLDVNANIFILSATLFISRFVLRKKVFLLGVGYYSSTNRMGRISAWLAAKGATHIIARDKETLANFSKITKSVSQDTDMAWYINDLDLAQYEPDVALLAKRINLSQKTLCITLRRFAKNRQNNYAACIEQLLGANQHKPTVIALMEPKTVDPEGFAFATSLSKRYKNVSVIDFSYNPLVLYMLFRKYHKKLVVIAPQFHTIITAALTNVPFMPISYDNKVSELFSQIGVTDFVPLVTLTISDLQKFIDKSYGENI